MRITSSQVEQIDRAARELLQDPGIMVEDEQIYELLLNKGAKAGSKALVARLPQAMIDEFLALAS